MHSGDLGEEIYKIQHGNININTNITPSDLPPCTHPCNFGTPCCKCSDCDFVRACVLCSIAHGESLRSPDDVSSLARKAAAERLVPKLELPSQIYQTPPSQQHTPTFLMRWSQESSGTLTPSPRGSPLSSPTWSSGRGE